MLPFASMFTMAFLLSLINTIESVILAIFLLSSFMPGISRSISGCALFLNTSSSLLFTLLSNLSACGIRISTVFLSPDCWAATILSNMDSTCGMPSAFKVSTASTALAEKPTSMLTPAGNTAPCHVPFSFHPTLSSRLTSCTGAPVLSMPTRVTVTSSKLLPSARAA